MADFFNFHSQLTILGNTMDTEFKVEIRRVNFARGSSDRKQYARQDQHSEMPSSSSSISLDRMPSEVLVKILSYLDVVTLVCIGCVSRRFYHLAGDNLIWARKYSAAFTSIRSHWNTTSVEETARSVNILSVWDKEDGYWKKEYITKQISSVQAALTHNLGPVNHCTGLPWKTKETLRTSGLGWTVILREASGKEHTMKHSDLSLNDTSVTVLWHDKKWPHLDTLSTLELYGTIPVFMEQYNGPDTICPRWLSLIEKYDLSNLSKTTMIGCDRHVQLFCVNPGLLVGLWQKNGGIAFIMANLHFHFLVERSTLGSDTIPYALPPYTAFVHDDPEVMSISGHEGYQLHIDIHGSRTYFLCSTFCNLFSRKAGIENGYVKFMVINLKNNREHLPLVGKVGLEWSSDLLNGCIESCLVVDMTLLNEQEKPIWCVSSPVCLRSSSCLFDFLQRAYSFEYMDTEGGVRADLGWIEDSDEYVILSLDFYLSVATINHWFKKQ